MADADQLDLTGRRRLHVCNIGGAGMSAVATLLAEMGHEVSGHDPAADTPFLGPLRRLGVAVTTGDAPSALPEGTDAVVLSTATPVDHPQVVAARAAGVPVVHRTAALAALTAERRTVAIAGTHGKTTTSALVATILHGAGTEPGWVIGASVAGLGRSATWGGAGPLVVEADESDGTFLGLATDVAVVTTVEPDHLEYWGSLDGLVDGFRRFLTAAPRRIVCADDPVAAELGVEVGAITYGTAAGSTYGIDAITTERGAVRFSLHTPAGDDVTVHVHAPGEHNARNATAAIAAAVECGVDVRVAVEALGAFQGVARRFEHRGEVAGVTFVDSYDHLPTEVASILRAAKAGGWRRVVCVFQPHRYSRMATLSREFADAFADADLLAITDIFPAGEAPREGVSGRLVLHAVLDAHPWKQVAYLPTLDDVLKWLPSVLRPGDVCLTLGAGDLTTLPDRVIARLEADA